MNPAKNRTLGALVHDVVMYDFVMMRRTQFAARNMKKSSLFSTGRKNSLELRPFVNVLPHSLSSFRSIKSDPDHEIG